MVCRSTMTWLTQPQSVWYPAVGSTHRAELSRTFRPDGFRTVPCPYHTLFSWIELPGKNKMDQTQRAARSYAALRRAAHYPLSLPPHCTGSYRFFTLGLLDGHLGFGIFSACNARFNVHAMFRSKVSNSSISRARIFNWSCMAIANVLAALNPDLFRIAKASA